MTARPSTRASTAKLTKPASRPWSAAQMAAGLHYMVRHGGKGQQAVNWVNSNTPVEDTHRLSRGTLLRMYDTLPPLLQHPKTSSQGLLLQHIHTHQAAMREEQYAGQTLLTAVEEALLVDWIVRQYNMNAPASPEEVKQRAQQLMEQRTGKPYELSMRRWYEAFYRRHPDLTVRIPENMPRSRLNAEQKHRNIAHFFSLLRSWQMLKPEQIYAADETGLAEDGSRRSKAVVPKGVRRVYRNSFGFYEHVSILHIGNAKGNSLPPVWIFKGSAHDAELADDFTALCGDSVYGTQKNGYFTADHFLSVLQHFVRHAVSTRPLLLISDGASSHINEESLEYAKANDINILLLPSHTTHLLQVADVAVFRPFKAYWRAECDRLRAAKRHTCAPGDIGVRRSDILPAALEAWEYATTTENVISGFRRTGIYPFNPRAYLKTLDSHTKSTSLTSLPPLLSSPLANTDLPPTPILSELVRSPALADPPQASTTPRPASKKRVRRTLDTSAGVLLTGADTIAQLQALREAEEAAAAAKKQRVEDRTAKREEKVRLTAEKKAQWLVKKAERAAVAAAKAAAKIQKRAKVTEEVEAKDEDKENVSPNVSAVMRAAAKPTRYVCTVVSQRRGAVLRMRKSD